MAAASEAMAAMAAKGIDRREGSLTVAAAMAAEATATEEMVTGDSGRRQQWITVTATGDSDGQQQWVTVMGNRQQTTETGNSNGQQ